MIGLNIRFDTRQDGSNAWSFRSHRVLSFLHDANADFIGLQEVLPSQRRQLQQALPGFGWIGRTRERSAAEGESNPILYNRARWVLIESRSGTFWLSETPDEPGSRSWRSSLPRIATWGVFRERETGQGVLVLNTHWDHASQEARERSALQIAQFLARESGTLPVIVIGDFNAGPANPARRSLLEGVDGSAPLRDTYAVMRGGDERSAGTYHGFRGGTDGLRIDAILVSDGVEILEASIVHTPPGGEHLSDHYPVMALLRIVGASSRPDRGEPTGAPAPAPRPKAVPSSPAPAPSAPASHPQLPPSAAPASAPAAPPHAGSPR